MRSQAPSLRTTKLRCYFSCLPRHFGTEIRRFSFLRDHQNQAFRSRGFSFLRISHFSVEMASSTRFRSFLGRFSGPLGRSGGAPGTNFRGQNGKVTLRTLPFRRTCAQLRFRPPKCCPRSFQNDAQTSKKCPRNFQYGPKTSPNPAPWALCFASAVFHH